MEMSINVVSLHLYDNSHHSFDIVPGVPQPIFFEMPFAIRIWHLEVMVVLEWNGKSDSES